MKAKNHFLLATPLILSLLLISCGQKTPLPISTPTLPEYSPAATVSQTSQPQATQSTNPTQSPTQVNSTTGGGTVTPTLASTISNQTAELNSYRVTTIHYENASGGPIHDSWINDVILKPLSVHYLSTHNGKQMEIILLGNSLWTKMLDAPWNETKITETDEWLTQQLDKPSGLNLEEGVPLENDLTWLTGQPKLNIAKGSMTPAGEEMVNGIPCTKYTVDSTYFYTATFTAPINATGVTTYQDQGEVWVANQSGWPRFVVRARLTEVVTTKVSSNSKSETFYIEQDVTDINSPDIKIESPQ